MGALRTTLALVPLPNTHLTSFHGVESTPRRLAAHGDAAADAGDTVTDAKDEATRASPPPRLGHAAPAHRKAPTSCAAPVAAAGAVTPSTPPGRRQKERLLQLGHRLALRKRRRGIPLPPVVVPLGAADLPNASAPTQEVVLVTARQRDHDEQRGKGALPHFRARSSRSAMPTFFAQRRM